MIVSSLIAAMALSTSAHAASPGKAAICHWDANQASVIEVSVRAVSQHQAQHGDSFPATYYPDVDGDGFGDPDGATDACPNAGYVANNFDCDDGDAAVNPDATEIAYNGIDDDCSALSFDDDLDQDGFILADDCDDTDAGVNPGAEEVCGNEVDDNCDGSIDEGCATDCPCFTREDLDAAWLDFTTGLEGSYDYEYSYQYCYDYDYTYSYSYDYGYGLEEWSGAEDGVSLYFQNSGSNDYYSGTYAYENEYWGFYGWHYEYDYSNPWGSGEYQATYCNGYEGSSAYDGSNYSGSWSDNWRSPITEDERQGCEDVLLEYIEDNALTCYVYHN